MNRRLTVAVIALAVFALTPLGLSNLAASPAGDNGLAASSLTTGAPAAGITWIRTYGDGGRFIEWPQNVKVTPAGGYIAAGRTESPHPSNFDAWVLQLDAAGHVLWSKTYGGAKDDNAVDIVLTSEGDYLIGGATNSFGAGCYDFWLFNLDSSGNLLWQKTYGGIGCDFLTTLAPTSDGGYLLAGETNSFGQGNFDAWLLKVDHSGNLLWQKSFGGIAKDYINAMARTSDGNYVLAGYTYSFGAGQDDAWVVKVDEQGNILWQKTYGGSLFETLWTIAPTPDGGYIAGGRTTSFGAGDQDVWVLKLDGGGDLQWQMRYGGPANDLIGWHDLILPLSNDGYIAAAFTDSFGGGLDDVWLLKLDGQGHIAWQKTYGGYSGESPYSMALTPDGGYVVAGINGQANGWMLKLDGQGNVPNSAARPCSLMRNSPTAATAVLTSGAQADSAALVADTIASVSLGSGVSADWNPLVTTQCGPPLQ